jgi:hypothetical protein
LDIELAVDAIGLAERKRQSERGALTPSAARRRDRPTRSCAHVCKPGGAQPVSRTEFDPTMHAHKCPREAGILAHGTGRSRPKSASAPGLSFVNRVYIAELPYLFHPDRSGMVNANWLAAESDRSELLNMIKNCKHLHGVYSVVSDEGGRDFWVEIGYATPHADGRGFDLTLRALPLERKLVLREPSLGAAEGDTSSLSLAHQVREFERAAITQCLLETGGNITAALERLKIPRRTLSEKMARLGINRRLLASPPG